MPRRFAASEMEVAFTRRARPFESCPESHGKSAAKALAGDEPEDAIAEKFQAFVVGVVHRLAMRAVREREIQMFGMLEAVAQHRFEGGAFVVGRNALAGLSHRV